MEKVLIKKDNEKISVKAKSYLSELRFSFSKKIEQDLFINVWVHNTYIIEGRKISDFLDNNKMSLVVPIKLFESYLVEVTFFGVKKEFEVSGLI